MTWSSASDELMNSSVNDFAVRGNTIYAGTNKGVFLSTNNGGSWMEISKGLISKNVRKLVVSNGIIIVGTEDGASLSTDNGASWVFSINGLTDDNVQSLAIMGSNIFAGTRKGGAFLSINNGTSWIEVNNGLTNRNVETLTPVGNNIFAGTEEGVFFSKDNGASWRAINNGLTHKHIVSFATNDQYIYAAASYPGIFRMNLSSIPIIHTTGKPDQHKILSISTSPDIIVINYTLPSTLFTQLGIYTISGKPITSIVNQVKYAGNHSITLKKNLVSTGTYIIRISAGMYQESMKTIILK